MPCHQAPLRRLCLVLDVLHRAHHQQPGPTVTNVIVGTALMSVLPTNPLIPSSLQKLVHPIPQLVAETSWLRDGQNTTDVSLAERNQPTHVVPQAIDAAAVGRPFCVLGLTKEQRPSMNVHAQYVWTCAVR